MSLAFYVFHFRINEIPLKKTTDNSVHPILLQSLIIKVEYCELFMGSNLFKMFTISLHCMKKKYLFLRQKLVYLISCFRNCTIFGISAK